MSGAHEQVRLAIVSTPRSGNCWLRHMLAQSLDLQEIIVHLPCEVPWDNLPARAIIQLHWMPDEFFRGSLNRHGFKVVVLSRHPLDCLISALVFSQHDDSTLRWLAGAGGDERCIAGAEPLSERFINYAMGSRAKALLGVSASWWNLPEAVSAHYEDLVLNPAKELEHLVSQLGFAPRISPADVAARSTADDMRAQNIHMLFHVWQAQKSLWRQFLPADVARRICAEHPEVLNTLGYTCDPDESLTAATAAEAWQRHDAAGVKRHLHGVKGTLIAVQSRLNQDSDAYHQQLQQQREELAQLRGQLEGLLAQQTRLDGLGPWSIGAARSLQRVAHSFPRATALAKSLVLRSRRMRPSRG